MDHAAGGVRRRALVASALPDVEPDAADMEAQEAQRRLDRMEQRFDHADLAAQDFSLAAEVCGSFGIGFIGSRLSCVLCHSAPCKPGCPRRELAHGQQAEYEWRLAKRAGGVGLVRPRAEIAADLARLRAVVGAAVEGCDVDALFADAPLCAAVDACRPALSAAADATPEMCRVLTRVCRLELLELLERDLVVWELPAGTPAALRAALAALRAALQASPELERAHCVTAVAAQAAEPPSDGWTLNFLRAENGPACPVPCEGALVIAFRPFLQAGSAPAVLGRLMPALAAAAGQPASSVRMPRDGGRLHDEEDEEDDEDDEDEDDFGAVCAAVMALNGFQPLIRVVARGTSSRGVIYHHGVSGRRRGGCGGVRSRTRRCSPSPWRRREHAVRRAAARHRVA